MAMFLFGWLLVALVTGTTAALRGRSATGWTLLALVIPPPFGGLAWATVALLPRR